MGPDQLGRAACRRVVPGQVLKRSLAEWLEAHPLWGLKSPCAIRVSETGVWASVQREKERKQAVHILEAGQPECQTGPSVTCVTWASYFNLWASVSSLVTWWRPYHLTGYPHGSREALGTASVWSRVSLDLRSAALPEPESPTCSLCALNINLQTHIRDATLAIYTPHLGFGEKGNYGAKMHVNETLGSIPHGPGVSAKRCAGAAALDWDEMMHNWYSHQRKCQSSLIQEHILKIIN